MKKVDQGSTPQNLILKNSTPYSQFSISTCSKIISQSLNHQFWRSGILILALLSLISTANSFALEQSVLDDLDTVTWGGDYELFTWSDWTYIYDTSAVCIEI
jgi:hypothetical protein